VAKQLDKSGRLVAGATLTLLVGLACSSAFASNGIKLDCDEANDTLPAIEIPTPSLVIRAVDHGLTDSAADMKDPASDPGVEKISSPALAEVTDVSLNNSSESSSADEDDAVPVNDLPETALRLPGVSEKEQPRFRRQMYRTDI
jgi:hypothetical protein